MSVGIVALARRLFRSPAAPTSCPAPRRRVKLGGDAFALEDRAVPTAVPTTGAHGGALVKVATATVNLKTNDVKLQNGAEVYNTVTFQNAVGGGAFTAAANGKYVAVAHESGTIDGTANNKADAEWLRFNGANQGQDGASPGYEQTNHGVRLIGMTTTTGKLDRFWGDYQQDNQYVKDIVTSGGAVKAYYRDVIGKYADNNGTITVDLYEERSVVTITGTQTAYEYDDTHATPGPKNGSITFQRTGDTNKAETITFSVGGTATYGSTNDFTLTGNGVTYNLATGRATVRFEQGEQYATVTIVPVGDDDPEGEESVDVQIVPGNGYVPGAQDSASATLKDTSGPASLTLDFATMTIPTGTSYYNYQFRVELAGGGRKDVEVEVTSSSTATSIRDSVEAALQGAGIIVASKGTSQLIIRGDGTNALTKVTATSVPTGNIAPKKVGRTRGDISTTYPDYVTQ